MNGTMNSFVDNAVQCWGCPVFDRLFQIVSDAAAAVYDKFIILCVVLFAVLFGFVILNIVWKNIKGGGGASYIKSLKPLVINSLVTLTFLGMGITLPRFVSTITFEPVAQITLVYTQSMLHTDNESVAQRVDYQPMEMPDNGFFRPELRDTIIMLMKTTITQFQSYMKLGIVVMDKAFEWDAFLGPGALLKHIVIFFIGLYLFYGFFKLFINFCFYFVDIIVAMTFFAFLFPLGLTMMAFKGSDAPAWMSKLGSGIGAKQIKNLINAIITLAAAVITYTVIMVVIAKFFSDAGASPADLVHAITSGDALFESSFSDDNLETLTIAGCVVLVYIVNYLYSQIPKVTEMVLSTFDVKTDSALSESVAAQATGWVKSVTGQIVSAGKNVLTGGKSGGTASGGGASGGASSSTGGTP